MPLPIANYNHERAIVVYSGKHYPTPSATACAAVVPKRPVQKAMLMKFSFRYTPMRCGHTGQKTIKNKRPASYLLSGTFEVSSTLFAVFSVYIAARAVRPGISRRLVCFNGIFDRVCFYDRGLLLPCCDQRDPNHGVSGPFYSPFHRIGLAKHKCGHPQMEWL